VADSGTIAVELTGGLVSGKSQSSMVLLVMETVWVPVLDGVVLSVV